MTHTPQQDHDQKETAGVLVLPPLLFALPVVLGWILGRIFSPPAVSTALRVVGIVVMLLSLIPGMWALVVMLRAGVNPEPHVPVSKLVLTGPFRFTRNPIYLTYILFIVGFSLVASNVWMLILLMPTTLVAHYGIVLREEHYLSRRFGAPYEDYRRRVRRWL
ncbi:MAG: isoprenylcysteine carboxylmethyltransferase family protein [Anaerolineae bacterium]